MKQQISIEQLIASRLQLIEKFIITFKNEFESDLSHKFLRGPIQKAILKKHKLPVNGPNMRLINESLEQLGYKKIYHNGWSYFKKLNEAKNG